MTMTMQREVQLAEAPVQAERLFFVLMRSNGHWSPGAKIMGVYATEAVAELQAAQEKRKHPHQAFGVAALCSEAREVKDPIEIVKVS